MGIPQEKEEIYKGLKVKPVYQKMTLSAKLGVVEICTLWHIRLPLLIQIFIKVFLPPDYQGLEYPPQFSDLIC